MSSYIATLKTTLKPFTGESRWFNSALLWLFFFGAVLRLLYAYSAEDVRSEIGDDDWYWLLGRSIADGDGYVKPYSLSSLGEPIQQASSVPTAWHSPLFPLMLAVFRWLGVQGFSSQQALCCVVGASTVIFVGLIGQHIAGRKVGLLAALLVAVYPPLVVSSAVLASESLYVPLVVLLVLLALRAESTKQWVLVGLVGGLAVLTRSEALILVALLGLYALYRGKKWRLNHSLAVVLTAVLVASPWLVRNWYSLGRPVLATSHAPAMAGSNCESAYSGDFIGVFVAHCLPDAGPLVVAVPGRERELEDANSWVHSGLSYANKHRSRVPVVMSARVLRTWQLYRPFFQRDLDAYLFVYTPTIAKVGTDMYFILLGFAVVGVISIRRRRKELFLLLVPILTVSATVAFSYGSIRFRAAAEPTMIVFSAVGMATVLAKLSRKGLGDHQ